VRIAEGRAALKKKSRRIGGMLPLGYDVDPRTKQLAVNASEAKVVKAMFRMARDGMTPADIAGIANGKAWLTKERESTRTGKVMDGTAWTARSVLHLLSNPTYTGKIKYGDGHRRGIHGLIISDHLFGQVREKIESRRKRKPGR